MSSVLGKLQVLVSADTREFSTGLDQLGTTAQQKLGGVNLLARGVGTTLVTVGVLAFNSALKVDEAWTRVLRRTGAVGEDARRLRRDFDAVLGEFPDDVDRVGTAITGLHQRLNLTGPALQSVAGQVLNLSRLTGDELDPLIESTTRLMGDWSRGNEQTGSTLDYLYSASQKTGVGVTRLATDTVKYGAILRGLGLSMESSVALMARWNQEGVNIETVMAGLREANKRFAASGRDGASALAETIEQIRNADDATGRLLARQAVGAEAAADFFDTVKAGKFDVAALSTAIGENANAINRTATETETETERMQKAWRRAEEALGRLGEKLLPLLDGFAKLIDLAADAADAIGHLNEDQSWGARLDRTLEGAGMDARGRVLTPLSGDAAGTAAQNLRMLRSQMGPMIAELERQAESLRRKLETLPAAMMRRPKEAALRQELEAVEERLAEVRGHSDLALRSIEILMGKRSPHASGLIVTLTQLGLQARELGQAAAAAAPQVSAWEQAQIELGEALRAQKGDLAALLDGAVKLDDVLAKTVAGGASQAAAARSHRDELLALRDAYQALGVEMPAQIAGWVRLAEGIEAADKRLEENRKNLDAARAATASLDVQLMDLNKSYQDHRAALEQGLADGTISADEFNARMRELDEWFQRQRRSILARDQALIDGLNEAKRLEDERIQRQERHREFIATLQAAEDDYWTAYGRGAGRVIHLLDNEFAPALERVLQLHTHGWVGQEEVLRAFEVESRRLIDQVGGDFRSLDDMLQQTAARAGVTVQQMVASWALATGLSVEQVMEILKRAWETSEETYRKSFTAKVSASLRVLANEFGEVFGDRGSALGMALAQFADFVDEELGDLEAVWAKHWAQITAMGLKALGGLFGGDSAFGRGLSGAGSGFAMGAAIGSVVPGIGSVVGGLIGGGLGFLGGLFGGSPSEAELRRREEEARRRQEAYVAETEAMLVRFEELVADALINGTAYSDDMARMWVELTNRGVDLEYVMEGINAAIEDQAALIREAEEAIEELPGKIYDAQIALDQMHRSMSQDRQNVREARRALWQLVGGPEAYADAAAELKAAQSELRAAEEAYEKEQSKANRERLRRAEEQVRDLQQQVDDLEAIKAGLSFRPSDSSKFAQGEMAYQEILDAIEAAKAKDSKLGGYITEGEEKEILQGAGNKDTALLISQLIEMENARTQREMQIKNQVAQIKEQHSTLENLRHNLPLMREKLASLEQFKADFGSKGFDKIHADLGRIEELLGRHFPGYAGGGAVTSDQMAVLHAGEAVLSPQMVQRLAARERQMAVAAAFPLAGANLVLPGKPAIQPAGGVGGGVTVHLGGVTINTDNPASLKNWVEYQGGRAWLAQQFERAARAGEIRLNAGAFKR